MDDTNMNRRRFMSAFARTGLLALLTALGAVLVWRRLRKGDCANLQACRGCAVYAACPVRRDRERDPS